MKWTVETLDERVKAEIMALPEGIQARVIHILEMIEQVGLEQVHEPHIKHLEDKLWEIRAKAPDGIGRAVYITASGRRLVILHAFVKKTQKTPKQVLEIARQRAREVRK
ncbi:MAG: type II toxin-antitoxin system RelE/ParE family toxin [Acidithiobacillus ferrooxidans]|nr:type II toxin-antitoxin system RelE/ParE family toxin [Acidithiobacillus ferruginosus]MDD2747809.1 type II toxin-antitoxin system RelE/ParE family toxin [Acidithiobacillus ferrooxidans]MDD5002759.1 type II toxin-antitoxin system RelE/ParE family toxin [Acidithiobacillus sp.]MDD5377987.1 type II toxin-antitoxin system RelE/ParE family toxin [Acidithiobacillus sp.]